MSPSFQRFAALFAAFTFTAITAAEGNDALEIEDAEILSQTDVRFPATMRTLGIKEGHVSLVLAIDQDGGLADAFVLKSSRQDFAKSALKSIGNWTFAPATCNGEPFASAIRIDLNFKVDQRLTWQTFQAPVETNVTQSGPPEAPITSRSFGELDAIPLPLEIVEPELVEEGQATIEFYIDELGNARCPKLTAGNNLAFGRSMLETVSQWRFQPPVAGGVRTNTMVRQTFTCQDGKLTASR